MSKEKNEFKKIKEKLCYKRENGGKSISDAEMKKSQSFAEGYKDYLNKAKTERENVTYVLNDIKNKGFKEFDKNKKYKPGDKVYLVNRERGIILAVIGKDGVKNGTRFSIAHIDAPRLDLKPNPLMENSDFAMLKTHYYGGIKKYQ